MGTHVLVAFATEWPPVPLLGVLGDIAALLFPALVVLVAALAALRILVSWGWHRVDALLWWKLVNNQRTPLAVGILAAVAIAMAYSVVPSLVPPQMLSPRPSTWLPSLGELVALVLQGALSLLGWQVYCHVLLRQLGLECLGWPARLMAVVVGVCGAVCGWEVFAWPVPFIVTAEILLIGLPQLYLAMAKEQRIGRVTLRLPAALALWLPLPAWRPGEARFRVWVVVVRIAFGLALTAIWLRHFTSWYPTAVFGLFALICLSDDVLVSLLALGDWSASAAQRARCRARCYVEMLHPHRWQMTVPTVLAITYLGAVAWLAPGPQLGDISASAWIEAGCAGAVFLLFRGEADLARRDRYHEGAPLLERERAEIACSHRIKRAAGEFRRLWFPTALVVLAAMYLFHWLYTSTDLHTLLVSDMGPVVFAVSALIVAVLGILVNKVHLEMSGLVAVEMFIIMLGCTGIAVLLMYVRPANPAPIALPLARGAASAPSSWLIIHAMAAEVLFLITVCLTAYVYHVIRVAQHIRSAPPEPDD